MNDAILNQGLKLALAWGVDWLQPIQERLAALHPELSKEELEDYNNICREAMFAGFKLVETGFTEESATVRRKNQSDSSDAVVNSAFKAQMLKQYPWVNDDNLSRLFSQGMYYKMK